MLVAVDLSQRQYSGDFVYEYAYLLSRGYIGVGRAPTEGLLRPLAAMSPKGQLHGAEESLVGSGSIERVGWGVPGDHLQWRVGSRLRVVLEMGYETLMDVKIATRPTTVVYIATSLDGFIARPDGAIDWLGEPAEGEDYGWAEFIATIDAIVMGRVTYEQVVSFGAWPYEGTPLTVLSRSLKTIPDHLKGKAEISSMEPSSLLEHLAARGCKRVYVDGGRTIQSFMRAALIDELVITRIPILIGQGIPLFGPLDGDMEWEHAATKTLAKGLIKSSYRRRRGQ